MKTIDCLSLPVIRFAHVYSSEKYHNTFTSRSKGIEVSYISDGELHFETNNQSFSAHQNDVLCLMHGSYSRISSDVYHAHHTVCAMMDWEYLDSPVTGFYLPVVTPQSQNTTHIRQLIDSFIYGQNSYEESRIRNAYQFLSILSEIDSIYRSKEHTILPESHIHAERAKKYIHAHLHEKLSLTQVAEHLDISPGYLCSIFKDTQGIPLIQYINKTKLEAISQIMEKEHLKLYEAATLFGFTDANYVSRLYKKLFRHNITSKPSRSDHFIPDA